MPYCFGAAAQEGEFSDMNATTQPKGKKQKQPAAPKGKKVKQSTAVKVLSILSVTAVALVLIMLVANQLASNRYDKLSAHQQQLTAATDRLRASSDHLCEQIRAFAATSDQKFLDVYYKERNETKGREAALASLTEMGLTGEEQALVSQISELIVQFTPTEDTAIGLAQAARNHGALEVIYGSFYSDQVNQVSALSRQLDQLVRQRTDTGISRMSTLIDVTFFLTFVCLALVIAAQFALVIYVSRQLLDPVLKIKENMHEMAKGNLQAQLTVDEDDTEIGQLAAAVKNTKLRTATIVEDMAFVMDELARGNYTVRVKDPASYVGDYEPILASIRTMRQTQNDTLHRIGSVADQVYTNSHQVANAAQAAAQGATEQAASIDQLGNVIDNITQKTIENALNVDKATQLVNQAGEEIGQGNAKMLEMVSAMADISEKSEKISHIIKTIDDIAFQINILALNAAVEAASAGQAGKGFAVVATEVKNLANKSAQAAADTTQLIDSSVAAVQRGSQLAGETADQLAGMVESTQQIVNIIREIAAASDQQTDGASQIAEGITQIATVVQANSASAEQTAAASVELSHQADSLNTLVEGFRLEDTADSQSAEQPLG